MTLNPENTKVLIVGLGQLGGDYAQALSQQGFEIGAIDIDGDAIEYALEKGWIRHGRSFDDGAYIGQFDLVVSALYPHVFVDWVTRNRDALKPGALMTDVTGVKSAIVAPIQRLLPPTVEFIAAHPMAGRETSGIRSSNKDIFLGANFIVTPTEQNSQAAIDTCIRLGELLGFTRISILSPDEHDEIIAFVSQLTHCIAVALMLTSDSEKLADYTGDSFRDLTRIARINDEMWSELFLTNREKLLTEMELFTDSLQMIRDSLVNNDVDSLREYMRLSTRRRKLFDRKKDEG